MHSFPIVVKYKLKRKTLVVRINRYKSREYQKLIPLSNKVEELEIEATKPNIKKECDK